MGRRFRSESSSSSSSENECDCYKCSRKYRCKEQIKCPNNSLICKPPKKECKKSEKKKPKCESECSTDSEITSSSSSSVCNILKDSKECMKDICKHSKIIVITIN